MKRLDDLFAAIVMRAFALSWAWFAAGCSVYDPALLPDEVRDDPRDSGSGNASNPPGDVMTGTGREARCGDGILTAPAEKCDTGILAGASGACPTECPALGACIAQELSGGACLTECVVVAASCKAGDDCCPGGCTADTDADCSSSCGDGTVQAAEGETCEPTSATDACPTACDDGDDCTTDVLTGSAANCNADCASTPGTALVAGDGCCPEGANSNTDADCTAECGNGVREPPEECDGTAGCDSSCKVTMTSAQERCMALFPSPDACEMCACLNCTQLVLDCYDSGDATRDMLCVDVVSCARDSDCTGTPCFCGTQGVFDCTLAPAGPCVPEIQAATGAPDTPTVFLRQNDPMFAVGRANLLGTCSAMNCPADCP